MSSDDNKRTFSGDVARFFSANVFNLLAGIVTSILIARVLGPTGRGAASLLILVPTLLANGLSLGIHQANVYFVNPQRRGLGVVMTNSMLLLAAVSALVVPVMFLLENRMISWLNLEEYRTAYRWSCALLPVFLANLLFVNVLVGQKRFTVRNISVVMIGVLQLVLAVVVVWLLSAGVAGWVAALVTADVAAVLFMYYMITGFRLRSFARPSLTYFKESTVFGLKGQIGNILQIANYRLDMFLVNYFLGLNAVGVYTISVRIAELPWMLPQVVGNVLFAMTSSDEDKYDDKHVASSARKTILILIAAGVAIIATGWFVVPLVFGADYAGSVLPLVILAPSCVAVGLHKILVQALMGKGHPQYMSYTAAIALAVTLVLDFVLIPLWGVLGAAAASTIAYSVCAACTLLWYTRESNLRWHEFVFPRGEDCRYLFDRFVELATKLFHVKPFVSRK